MKVQQFEDGSWIAEGDGDLRPIYCEASSREGAVKGWTEMFAHQYEEAAKQCALAQYYEENQVELRELAQGYRNYKGVH